MYSQVGVDAKLHDEMTRQRHLHEQEINKLLRENERLQKIIARYGGGQLSAREFPVVSETSVGDLQSRQPKVTSGYGNFQNFSSSQRASSSITSDVRPAATTASSKLNWGALNDSLAIQELDSSRQISGREYSSPDRNLRSTGGSRSLRHTLSPQASRVVNSLTGEDPPSTFALDEVLAQVDEIDYETTHGLPELGGPGKGGIRISDTAKKVESYLGKLQDYLEVSNAIY
jgi:hypothetical protein